MTLRSLGIARTISTSAETDRTRIRLRRTGATAVCMLLLFGMAYRKTAAHLVHVEGTVSLPRGTLAALPMKIGDWAGRDIPLDERVIRATDTDDHVHRAYVRGNGPASRFEHEGVSLFLAYGVRMRDLMPHRPEVCYPSAGWTFEGKKRVTILPHDGEPPVGGGEAFEAPSRGFDAQLLWFRHGGLDSERLAVLNYYIIDGRPCPDVSELRSKSWKVGGEVAYAAQIQIVATEHPLQAEAEESALTFAADAAAEVTELLDRAVRAASETRAAGE